MLRRRGRLVTAFAAGIAGGLIAPMLYPTIARTARPATKRVLKAGMAALERGKVAAAEFGEHASDLLAEVRAEYEDANASPAAPGDTAAASEIVKLRGMSGA